MRDMVMNIEPSDYDIATSAPPAEIMKIFPHTEPIGAQFGVVLVIHRGRPFEVATFRSDEAYVDGRRPTGVVFTDAQTDVLCRDFTINGLLYDPIEQRVIDYVSGQADIRDRIVRAIGNPEKRFEEDKLRLLRAIRFGARLGYSIEAETWAAVCRLAPEIKRVSAERIRDELGRILTEGRAALGFRLLHESGLLATILPGVRWSEQLERSLELIPVKAPMDFAFAVLLHEVPLDAVQQITQDLKLSTAEATHVVSLVKCLPIFGKLRDLPISELKRFLRVSRFEDHMELTRISATAARRDLDACDFGGVCTIMLQIGCPGLCLGRKTRSFGLPTCLVPLRVGGSISGPPTTSLQPLLFPGTTLSISACRPVRCSGRFLRASRMNNSKDGCRPESTA